ncbi:MAG TPA: eL32 family ribosomal protein, partial [Spirochaetia bacterium]|nr:eL32 family ribosomal protein [Spirochaetia bacterium]
MATTKQGKADSARKELLELLELRKSVADARPRFVRPESWRYVRLHPEWRKPKGLDNKIRKSFKGYPKRVKIGYGGPARARG